MYLINWQVGINLVYFQRLANQNNSVCSFGNFLNTINFTFLNKIEIHCRIKSANINWCWVISVWRLRVHYILCQNDPVQRMSNAVAGCSAASSRILQVSKLFWLFWPTILRAAWVWARGSKFKVRSYEEVICTKFIFIHPAPRTQHNLCILHATVQLQYLLKRKRMWFGTNFPHMQQNARSLSRLYPLASSSHF